jgi:hypothetical protein
MQRAFFIRDPGAKTDNASARCFQPDGRILQRPPLYGIPLVSRTSTLWRVPTRARVQRPAKLFQMPHSL